MLINWVGSDIDNTTSTNFYNELKLKGINPAVNFGYPINCKNIAISNGSECGVTQGFNAGDDLFNLDINKGLSFWGDLLSLVYNPIGGYIGAVATGNVGLGGVAILGLIPGHSRYHIEFYAKSIPYGAGNQIYKGRISYTKKILWIGPNITVNITNVNKNQPTGVLPLDYYGGGFYGTSLFSGTQALPAGAYVRDRFNFIPTTSALDIGKKNITLVDLDFKNKYIGAIPPITPKNTPFSNFATDFDFNSNTSNKPHISFSFRNGDWLVNELNSVNPQQTTNCSFICSDAQISGGTLCTTANYTAPLSNATFFNWTITQGANLATLSNATSQTATLTKVGTGSGNITLSLTLGNSICGSTVITKTIWAGKPSFPSTGIVNGATNVNFNETRTYTYSGGAPSGATTNYEWYVDAPINDNGGPTCAWQIISGQGSPSITFQTGCIATTAVVVVKATNSCGTDIEYIYVTITENGTSDPCNTIITTYPNPISNSNNLQVNLVNPDPCGELNGVASTTSAPVNNEVKIYDFYGVLVYSSNYSTDSMTLSNINLNSGNYILNVFTNTGKVLRKILVVQ